MYVIGAGRTKFGVLDDSLPKMAYEAIEKALLDANKSINDIDAIYVANFLGGPLQNQLHLNSVMAGLFPDVLLPIIRVESACSSGGSALYQSIVSLSRFVNVLVVGVEKMSGSESIKTSKDIAMAGDRLLDQKEGLIFPANYALLAQQHMLRYKTTIEDMSLVALKNHRNANLNDMSHFYRKKVSLDMIRQSPVVCSPLRLMDCSPISDGAVALVLSREKKSHRDINIAASTFFAGCISLAQRRDLTSLPTAKAAAQEAYKQAGVKPSEIDIAEVHDCFTIGELIAMEDLRFCKPGESKNFIRNETTTLSGDLPINTDGGLKADGHPIGATGLAQVFEIITQLRGEAGKRQVSGAKIGLTHNIGGIGGTAAVHIFKNF